MSSAGLSDRLAQLRAQARTLPVSPGIYLMKNEVGEVIYVGKAKNLRHRVGSYFARLAHDQIKTQKLVSRIDSFEVTLVKTELEALLLERSLIRALDPIFNILLRDDKSFPYIRADLNQPWPRITIVRKRNSHDGATYIGPYSNQKLLFSSLEWVHKIFPLVRCSPYEFTHAKRPCNYYGMKLCLAPCHRQVDQEYYRGVVMEALKVLQGHHRGLAQELKTKMLAAAEAEDFGQAAEYRDQIMALKQLRSQDQSTYKYIKEGDVIAWCNADDLVSFYVLHVREHIVSSTRDFVLSQPISAQRVHHENPQEHNHVLEQFLMQFYRTESPPAKIVTMLPLERQQLISQALAHRAAGGDETESYQITPPQFGTPWRAEEKRLMEVALKNAQYVLLNHRKIHDTNQQAMVRIADELGVKLSLRRVECIDISHFAGDAMVAAKVSFLMGVPDKTAYRKYNIELAHNSHAPVTAGYNDDYEAIRQVIARRLAQYEGEEDPPDVIVIDGGKGQLSSAICAANQVLKSGAPRPYFLAIAKMRNHQSSLELASTTSSSTSAYDFDRVFVEGATEPILLHPGTPAHRLFAYLRDEAHRFAITHHRRTFSKTRHSSQLEQIRGIGPVTRKNLLHQFGSLLKLQHASIAELAAVKGMNLAKAQSLKRHLNH